MPAYKMTITPLSPVHIGSGEEIPPCQYVVQEHHDSEGEWYTFHALNMPSFCKRLSDKQMREFNKIAESGSTVHLRRFVHENVDLEKDELWKSFCNDVVFNRYCKGLESDNAQLHVTTMTRNPATGEPYLPGSSIKGALRTAWINFKTGTHKEPEKLANIRDWNFEPVVLEYTAQTMRGERSEIRADPLRALGVGDAPLCADSNTIEAVEIYKPMAKNGAADPAGILMFYDATYSQLDGEEITAEGRLVIKPELAHTDTRNVKNWYFDNCVSHEVDAPVLLRACNAFYKPRLESELMRFPLLKQNAEELVDMAGSMKDGEALIRLGRFSHKECMTVARDGGKPEKPGTTRSLFGGEVPMGWAKISLA